MQMHMVVLQFITYKLDTFPSCSDPTVSAPTLVTCNLLLSFGVKAFMLLLRDCGKHVAS